MRSGTPVKWRQRSRRALRPRLQGSWEPVRERGEGDRLQRPIAFKYSAGGAARTMPAYDDGTTPTLVTEKPPAVMLKVRGGADTYMKHDGSIGTAGKGALTSEETTFTLAATQDQTLFQPDADGYVVRRLTPVECERLQGFPDGWTDIGEWVDSKGKTRSTTDGARYKALGNSFAVPVVRWIGERIQRLLDQ